MVRYEMATGTSSAELIADLEGISLLGFVPCGNMQMVADNKGNLFYAVLLVKTVKEE